MENTKYKTIVLFNSIPRSRVLPVRIHLKTCGFPSIKTSNGTSVEVQVNPVLLENMTLKTDSVEVGIKVF